MLSVCIGVCGCACPILANIGQRYTAFFALRYNAPNSALAAEDITALIMVAFVGIAPLFGENWSLLDKKK